MNGRRSMNAKFEHRDDAEVAATAANSPEQFFILRRAHVT